MRMFKRIMQMLSEFFTIKLDKSCQECQRLGEECEDCWNNRQW